MNWRVTMLKHAKMIQKLCIVIVVLFFCGCGGNNGSWKVLKWGMNVDEVESQLKENRLFPENQSLKNYQISKIGIDYYPDGDFFKSIYNYKNFVATHVIPEGLTAYSFKRLNQNTSYEIHDTFIFYKGQLCCVYNEYKKTNLDQEFSLINALAEKHGGKKDAGRIYAEESDRTITARRYNGGGAGIYYFDPDVIKEMISENEKRLKNANNKGIQDMKDNL